MKLQHHFGVTFLIVFLLTAIIGCDDKKDPTSNDNNVEYMIIGTVIMRPGMEFLGSITSIYGQVNEIDSILIGDSLCTIDPQPNYVEGNHYTYSFTYVNYEDSLRFQSSDTAIVRIVKDGEITIIPIKLLKLPEDSLKVISPADQSTVAIGQNITIVWNKIPSADWYGIYYIHDTSSVFPSNLRQAYDYTTDTTYTIPGSEHPMNSDYRIFITPTTGPIPSTPGNIESPSMTGALYSSAIPGVREGWQIQVGTGANR